MHALTGWFIRNPVAANLIMLLIIVGGIFTAMSMRIEGFPKLPADTINITTTFADAYTEQVDRDITQKIEKALEGLPGVKKIQSISTEGLSSVSVQKNDGYKLQRLLDDIRLRLDGIYNLPRLADKPVISRNDFDFPALIVQIYGDTSPDTLQRLGRELRETLLALPEVSKLNIWGEKTPQIRVEIEPGRLEAYGLNTEEVAEKIQAASLSFKAGSLRTKGSHISLRADSQAYELRDFAEIPVFEHSDGNQLLLGELGTIVDGYEVDDVIVRFNGQPALGFEVLIGRKENLLDIADAVKKAVEKLRPQFPPEVQLSVWADSSHYISERLTLLSDNAIQGLLLVFVLLALFLNLKLAFWVAMGIPISISGALAVMGLPQIDYSLNDITTFGLIIALGILVDDAVVVGESVFSERRKNSDPIKGTEEGVRRVATATIYGVLTTIAAFFPMMLIQNQLGKVLASFAGVVILALLFSLFESKFILPAHLAHLSLDQSKKPSIGVHIWQRIQGWAQNGLAIANQRFYRPLLEWCLVQRYAVLIVFLAMATLGIGLVYAGKVKTLFLPDIPGQVITVTMEMDARAPYTLTLKNTDHITKQAETISQQLADQHGLDSTPIEHLLTVVDGAYQVTVYAELSPNKLRPQLGTLDILNQWKAAVGQLEGTTELTFSGTEETGGGFQVQLFGKQEDALRAASAATIEYLEAIDGLDDLRDSLKSGKPELYVRLRQEARHLGFSNAILASQIGSRFGGLEVQRIQRRQQEVRVVIIDPESSRSTLSDLMQASVQSESGHWFPLLAIATIESSYATDYIARRDGQRVNTIQASIDKQRIAPTEVGQALMEEWIPHLKEQFPSVTLSIAGELEETEALKGGLIRALIFTCILIYALLAIPLKSYWQPVIIMSVIPFGFVGATLGHLIMQIPLSILSFFGMLALAGVVVNDSLVMMSRYNQSREIGANVHEALMESGAGRFQAIFLTTTTTVAGLTPLMSETSEQAQYLIPAAVSLAFGEIFATAITLILIPVLIAISADVQRYFANKPAEQALEEANSL